MASWREVAAPIIHAVLKQTEGQDEKVIRKALHDAYPFGERSMHPYKIWCSEVQRQRGVVSQTKLRRKQLALLEEHNRSLFGEPNARGQSEAQ